LQDCVSNSAITVSELGTEQDKMIVLPEILAEDENTKKKQTEVDVNAKKKQMEVDKNAKKNGMEVEKNTTNGKIK
jgi:hypothetical protein